MGDVRWTRWIRAAGAVTVVVAACGPWAWHQRWTDRDALDALALAALVGVSLVLVPGVERRLVRRVFAQDMLECPRCRGRMKIIATVTFPEAVRKILTCIGLPARPPPATTVLRTRRASRWVPARGREQAELSFDE